jgi:hypothetical protein
MGEDMDPIRIMGMMIERERDRPAAPTSDSLAALVSWLGTNWGWLPPSDRAILLGIGQTLIAIGRASGSYEP